MKNILISALTLFMLAASMTSRAGAQNSNGFVGLWEAVDPEDGAHNILSITNNGDGTFKLLGYATYFTTCDGGRGLIHGTGTVSGQQTLKSDDNAVTCFEANKTISLPATFTMNSDGTLTWDRSAEPAPAPPEIIFHRTSNNDNSNQASMMNQVQSQTRFWHR